ncbi:MAG TPA: TSUP family transporter [Phycisphaerales bacterium]|nr:TSUP family transporter [Phycisphaerales bacterium]HMP35847.1 TSUP family transporter [Phycisphaerales bacterium]
MALTASMLGAAGLLAVADAAVREPASAALADAAPAWVDPSTWLLAWVGALLVGVTLGLLGSGGAILTVPILVYLVGHDEKSAIAESLAIVAAVAAFGALGAVRRRAIDRRSVLLLAPPGIVGTAVGALIARAISGSAQLALLAALMFAAAALMARSAKTAKSAGPTSLDAPDLLDPPDSRDSPEAVASLAPLAPLAPVGAAAVGRSSDLAPNDAAPAMSPLRATLVVLAQGLGLGVVTGVVGVGGGFLIVPLLVLLRRLPASIAVGTSLAIIAINAAAGFVKHAILVVGPSDAQAAPRLDWNVILLFIALGIAGSVAGSAIGARLPQPLLRRLFAGFLVLMATFMLLRHGPAALGWAPHPGP